MIGLTMNPLFYHGQWTFRCVGPTLSEVAVRDAVTRLLGPPYWPVSCDRMGAVLEFAEFPKDGLQVDGLRILSCAVPHPGGCLAYRIEDTTSGQSLVYATDMEWQDRTPDQEAAFLALCRGPKPADLLVMDAHFERAQAQTYAGWGHTCWQDDLEIAQDTGVRSVLLGHHAPEAEDNALFDVEQQVTQYMPSAVLARTGQWITVGQ
jgi:ribonuclease BN (tRNA processing enzyme)